ncbi:MAG: hypothetical protein U9O56_10065 [Campylobacterota bacterium]|nr:hypothetical protein [Campylobacterota bacterium]
MINLKNKKIFFSGRGEKIEKDELIKYFIQNNSSIVNSIDEANVIIQGYMTSSYDEDKFYLLSKSGIDLIPIDILEKEFSANLDIDSILIAIKISKDNQRVISLLKNIYFDDDTFVKILKYYDWGSDGIYDSDDNRDIATYITKRFCSLIETNHNIQHSPIGIYYTALETTNTKLLEVIYNMPDYSISGKNAKKYQPLTLKETVALNPNTSKPILIQILKNNNINQLKFLALNSSSNKLIVDKLLALNNKDIIKNLIKANNIPIENLDTILNNDDFKIDLLKNTQLTDEIFNKFIDKSVSDIEYIYLSSNLSLSTTQIDFLFDQNIDGVIINLLKNENTQDKYIEKYLNQNDKIYNISIAHNKNLKQKVFEKLYSYDDFDVYIELSLNSKTPKEILKNLFNKNKNELNIALSQNTNTPINILMQLQIDGRYSTLVSNNETYKEFSRNSLGIIQDDSNRFKRGTYAVN